MLQTIQVERRKLAKNHGNGAGGVAPGSDKMKVQPHRHDNVNTVGLRPVSWAHMAHMVLLFIFIFTVQVKIELLAKAWICYISISFLFLHC